MLRLSGSPGRSVSLLLSALIVSVSPSNRQWSKGNPSRPSWFSTEKMSSPGRVSSAVQPATGLLPWLTSVSWPWKWSKSRWSWPAVKVRLTFGGPAWAWVGACVGEGAGDADGFGACDTVACALPMWPGAEMVAPGPGATAAPQLISPQSDAASGWLGVLLACINTVTPPATNPTATMAIIARYQGCLPSDASRRPVPAGSSILVGPRR